jgi:hypothetical protein
MKKREIGGGTMLSRFYDPREVGDQQLFFLPFSYQLTWRLSLSLQRRMRAKVVC